TAVARLFVHATQVAVLRGPEPVANAVKPGQIGARLRRGDDVVSGDRVIGVRKADGHDLEAELRQQFDSLLDVVTDLGIEPGEVFVGHAHLQPAYSLAKSSRIVGD